MELEKRGGSEMTPDEVKEQQKQLGESYNQGHNHINPQVCPSCGYCPCCGRTRNNWNYPMYPYYPHPNLPYYQITCGGTK